MLCGNGGSAADAQHLAAEFLVRLRPNINRQPIAAITLAQDSSTLQLVETIIRLKIFILEIWKHWEKKMIFLYVFLHLENQKIFLKQLNLQKKWALNQLAFLVNLKIEKN